MIGETHTGGFAKVASQQTRHQDTFYLQTEQILNVICCDKCNFRFIICWNPYVKVLASLTKTNYCPQCGIKSNSLETTNQTIFILENQDKLLQSEFIQ